MTTKKTPSKKVAVKKVAAKKSVPVKKVAVKKTAPKKVVSVKKVIAPVTKKKEVAKPIVVTKPAKTTTKIELSVNVEDIKYKIIGNKLNIKTSDSKTLTSTFNKEDLKALETRIIKYNIMSEKARKLTTGQKAKESIYLDCTPFKLQEEKAAKIKVEQTKIEKKAIENKLKTKKQEGKDLKADIVQKPVVEKSEAKTIIEEELPKWERFIGYKHPVTGKKWNGETYV